MQIATTRHEVTEWRTGFAELLEGKPFHVRRDFGYQPGEVLIVREYDEDLRRLTGALAIFRITWVSRSEDYEGLLSGLIPPGTVILGLAPANALVSGNQVSVLVDDARRRPAPVIAVDGRCTCRPRRRASPVSASHATSTRVGSIVTCPECTPPVARTHRRSTWPNRNTSVR